MKSKLKISNKNIAIAGLAAVFVVVAMLFGLTGVRTIAAMLLFFFLPFYLILRKTSFETDEKVFFAFFIGLGLFSTFVFYVGRVIPSFRAATVITLIILLALPFIIKYFKKKNSV